MASSHIENVVTRQLFPIVSVALLGIIWGHSNHSPPRDTEAYKTKHCWNHDDVTTELWADVLGYPDRLGVSILRHMLNPVTCISSYTANDIASSFLLQIPHR